MENWNDDAIEQHQAICALNNRINKLTGKRFSIENQDTLKLVHRWIKCGYRSEDFELVAEWAARNQSHDLVQFIDPKYLLNDLFEVRWNEANSKNLQRIKQANRELDAQEHEAKEREKIEQAVEFLCWVKQGEVVVSELQELVYNQCRGVYRFFASENGIERDTRWRTFTPETLPGIEYIRDCGDGVSRDPRARTGNGYVDVLLRDLKVLQSRAGRKQDWFSGDFTALFLAMLEEERELYPLHWNDPKAAA